MSIAPDDTAAALSSIDAAERRGWVRQRPPRKPGSSESRGVGVPGWFWRAFAVPGVFWLIVLFLLPVYSIFALAFTDKVDIIFLSAIPEWNPLEWNPDAAFNEVLGEVFRGGVLQAVFLRTLVYVAVASALSLVIGYPVAYYIARHAGRTKTLLLILLIAPFWISYLMRMLAWVNLLEPEGMVNTALRAVGLVNSPVNWLNGRPMTVILGLVYGYVPFLILPLFAAIDRIDQSQIEASRDLGASPAKGFLRVTLPLSRQGILAGSVIILLPMFGDYYTQDLLSQNPKTSMVANQIDRELHVQGGASTGAAITIVLSLVLVVFMFYYLYSTARAAKEYSA